MDLKPSEDAAKHIKPPYILYNALRFVYNALRYVHNALCFVYNAVHYIVFCTEFQFKLGRTNKFTVKKYQLY